MFEHSACVKPIKIKNSRAIKLAYYCRNKITDSALMCREERKYNFRLVIDSSKSRNSEKINSSLLAQDRLMLAIVHVDRQQMKRMSRAS